MATDEDYPIDIPILVIEAQIFVAVKKFPFLPNKLIPTKYQVKVKVQTIFSSLFWGDCVYDMLCSVFKEPFCTEEF